MIVAAVPIKHLSEAKSRLSARLSPTEREALARALLARTIAGLNQTSAVDQVAIVSPQQELAESFGVVHLPDDGSLNGALRRAVEWALSLRSLRLLILPADLPYIGAEEIARVLESRRVGPAIDIASTQDGGTGALLLTPPDALPPLFGEGSFQRHLELARLRSVDIHRIEAKSFTFDLDTPEDLQALGIPLVDLLNPQSARQK